MAKQSKAVQPGQTYYHVVYFPDKKIETDYMEIGVFSHRTKALDVVKDLRKREGFNKKKGKFDVSRGIVDFVGWSEGFIGAEEFLYGTSGESVS